MMQELLKQTEDKMRATVEGLKRDLATIRTGRASPALVEHLRVDYSGVPTPLNQIAGISAPESRLLVIQPWDRSALHAIEKAVLKSELGLHPTSDGTMIRLVIPPLSQERRQELTRVVRRRLEERRVIIRNIRHEAVNDLRKLEKDKEISQDELRRGMDQLQKLTDRFIAEVDKVGQAKEADLMEV